MGTTPPQTATSPPPNGGNGVIRTTTRRRHADSQPLMLQNPHRHRRGGRRRDRRARAPQHRRDRKAGLRGTWAAVPVGGGARPDNEPTRRSKLAARTAEVGGLTPPPAEFRMQFPHRTNRHKLKDRRISTIRTQTPTCAHGKCMRNCWLTAIAGHQGDAPNHTSAH